MSYPKLEPEFKHKLLKALRSGCYHFIKGEFRQQLNKDVRDKATGRLQHVEYGYCTLGAAYHLAGVYRDDGSYNYEAELPSALLDSEVRDAIIGRNDAPYNHSYEAPAKWIEENL